MHEDAECMQRREHEEKCTERKEKDKDRWRRWGIIRKQKYYFYVFVIPHSDLSFIIPQRKEI
jgi:hypothetical protein